MSQTIRYGHVCTALVATATSACDDSAWGLTSATYVDFTNPAFSRRVGEALRRSFDGSGCSPKWHDRITSE